MWSQHHVHTHNNKHYTCAAPTQHMYPINNPPSPFLPGPPVPCATTALLKRPAPNPMGVRLGCCSLSLSLLASATGVAVGLVVEIKVSCPVVVVVGVVGGWVPVAAASSIVAIAPSCVMTFGCVERVLGCVHESLACIVCHVCALCVMYVHCVSCMSIVCHVCALCVMYVMCMVY